MEQNMRYVKSYIMSNTTFLVSPVVVGNKIHTIIFDKQGKVKLAQKPLRTIRSSCKSHGTTLTAAQARAKLFFGNEKHKLPIMLTMDFGNPCIFFPLFSPQSEANSWINLQSIINITPSDSQTTVTFKDQSEVTLPIHYKSFNLQYVRATMYAKHLMNIRRFPNGI